MIPALGRRQCSTRTPSNESRAPRGLLPVASRMNPARSSTENTGCLRGFTAIATITLSNSASDRSRMSTWPLVIGSNVPGYTAILRASAGIISPVEGELGVAVAATVRFSATPLPLSGRAAPAVLDHQRPAGRQHRGAAQRRERAVGQAGGVRRIEEDPVKRRARGSGRLAGQPLGEAHRVAEVYLAHLDQAEVLEVAPEAAPGCARAVDE